MFFKRLDFQKLTISMSFGLFLSTTNSSNLLSISSCTPITTKAMMVVAKGWNMLQENYELSFGRKCNFIGGLNAKMVVTFVVVESLII
jgi:ABC-type xylose transport system permease subunit